MQSETNPESASPPALWRIGLNVYLIYIALSNGWFAYRGCEIYWDLSSHQDPNHPHWPYLTVAVLSALNIVGAAGIWLRRKWGLVVILLWSVASLGIVVDLALPVMRLVPGLLGLAILCALVLPWWREFRWR